MRRLRIAGLWAVVLACGLTFAFAAWAGRDVGSAPGCWSPEQGAVRHGLTYRALLSGGRMRCYLAYVPPGMDRTLPAPLVLSLHGFAANPDGQRANARWEGLADSHAFIVAYPQGSSFPLRWNTGPETRLGELDDVRFLSEVIDDLAERWPIDPRRIFVTGFSNGGHMTHHAACLLADRVAAVGLVSGLAADPPAGCRPGRPVPVLAFVSGSDLRVEPLPVPDWLLDRILNLRLDQAAPGPSSPLAWAEAWAQRDGCRAPPTTSLLVPGVTRLHFGRCEQEAEVILVSIPEMGHAWPGGPALPGLGANTDAVDATQMMWDFFARHPAPSRP